VTLYLDASLIPALDRDDCLASRSVYFTAQKKEPPFEDCLKSTIGFQAVMKKESAKTGITTHFLGVRHLKPSLPYLVQGVS